ncbi:hypothetical protein ACTMU2_25630 [Cupriavidus basilensis]
MLFHLDVDELDAARSICERRLRPALLQVQPPDATGAGLTAIDHIARALARARSSTPSRAVLPLGVSACRPKACCEIADPYGLVKSRAMVLGADQRVRIPLNVSESGRTATGRFVAAYAGSGVHHIAFRSAKPRAHGRKDRIPSRSAMLHVPDNWLTPTWPPGSRWTTACWRRLRRARPALRPR